jgi:hypothetical protein
MPDNPDGTLDAEEILAALGRHLEPPPLDPILAGAFAFDRLPAEAQDVVRTLLEASTVDSRMRVDRLLSSTQRAMRPTRRRRPALTA